MLGETVAAARDTQLRSARTSNRAVATATPLRLLHDRVSFIFSWPLPPPPPLLPMPVHIRPCCSCGAHTAPCSCRLHPIFLASCCQGARIAISSRSPCQRLRGSRRTPTCCSPVWSRSKSSCIVHHMKLHIGGEELPTLGASYAERLHYETTGPHSIAQTFTIPMFL